MGNIINIMQDPAKAKEFIENVMTDTTLIPLGKGGSGSVYAAGNFPDYAVKISHSRDVCAEWKREYEIQIEAFNNWHGKYLAVPRPITFVTIANTCYLVMERICPLRGDSENFTDMYGKTAQALFGEPEELKIVSGQEGRGVFVGRNILNRYFSSDQMTAICAELGRFMAMMHYKLNLNALDLEVVAGPRCGVTKLKAYILDFGMVKQFNESEAVLSINAVNYFPLKDFCDYATCTDNQKAEQLHLADVFNEAYLKEASLHGKQDMAERILSSI